MSGQVLILNRLVQSQKVEAMIDRACHDTHLLATFGANKPRAACSREKSRKG